MAYPISDKDVLSFHYGWTYQTPQRSFIFENRGTAMGASNPHPHGQIWAQRSLPQEPAAEPAAKAAPVAFTLDERVTGWASYVAGVVWVLREMRAAPDAAADMTTERPTPPPPITSTLPFGNNVAVCAWRTAANFPLGVHVPAPVRS